MTFETLIDRVRQGDADAAATLIRQYEGDIRRLARLRLRDPVLARTLESMDICQSVLGNFFVRVTAGQFDFKTPEDLLKLLLTLTRNKIRDHARHQRAARRDAGRNTGGAEELFPHLAGSDPTASRVVAGREMLELLHGQLDERERQIVECRQQGLEWAQIAAKLGGSAEALRKKLTRALDRATQALGLAEQEA